MKKGRVFDNNKIGIYLLGVGSEPMIEDVIIDNNKGPGVKIGIGNKAQISACNIRFNRHGLELMSCSPLIKDQNIISRIMKIL